MNQRLGSCPVACRPSPGVQQDARMGNIPVFLWGEGCAHPTASGTVPVLARVVGKALYWGSLGKRSPLATGSSPPSNLLHGAALMLRMCALKALILGEEVPPSCVPQLLTSTGWTLGLS